MNNELFKKFYKKNKLLLVVFVIITITILPFKSIGTSSYISNIIEIIQQKKKFH